MFNFTTRNIFYTLLSAFIVILNTCQCVVSQEKCQFCILFFTCSSILQLRRNKASHTIALVSNRYNSECTKRSWSNTNYQNKQQSKQQKLINFSGEQCFVVSSSSMHGKPEASNWRWICVTSRMELLLILVNS